MRKLIVAVGVMAAGYAAISAEATAVTLESLQKEIRELKMEIRALRQETRMRADFGDHMPIQFGTNGVRRVSGKSPDGRLRPPTDPEARKAWFEARRREHEARLAERKAKQAASKPVQPTTISNNEQTTKDNSK